MENKSIIIVGLVVVLIAVLSFSTFGITGNAIFNNGITLDQVKDTLNKGVVQRELLTVGTPRSCNDVCTAITACATGTKCTPKYKCIFGEETSTWKSTGVVANPELVGCSTREKNNNGAVDLTLNCFCA